MKAKFSQIQLQMYTFNNSTVERIISISYKRFHSKQLENITKDHIAKHTLLNKARDWFLKIVFNLKLLYSLVP